MTYSKRSIAREANPILAALANRHEEIAARFWSKTTRVESGCLEWQAGLHKGYGRFKIAGRDFPAHRVALALHHNTEPDQNLCACHSCDNPRCVEPDHLWLGSIRDNMRDMYSKGRGNLTIHAFGEGCGKRCKLTLNGAIQALTDPRPGAVVARELGVLPAQVSAIRCGTAWVKALAAVGLNSAHHRTCIA